MEYKEIKEIAVKKYPFAVNESVYGINALLEHNNNQMMRRLAFIKGFQKAMDIMINIKTNNNGRK